MSATSALASRIVLRRGRLGPPSSALTIVCAGFIAVWVLLALLAPLVSPHDPTAIDILYPNAASSADHLLGTDDSGRDILSRLIWGARSALVGPLVVVLIAGTLAVVLALAAAQLRGWFDVVTSRVLDIIFAFPGILLALIGVAVLGVGLKAAVIALSISYIPYIARVIRADALRQTSLPYIQSGRLNGISGVAIATRHLIPNLAPLIVGQLTLTFGYATVDLASISFLGLGVQAPGSDWGLMVQEGQASILEGFPQESLYAGILIVALVTSVTILGDRLVSRQQAGRS